MLNIDDLSAHVEDSVRGVLETACRNIENGNTDNFRSYEEGVKDVIEWLFFGSDKPYLEND